MVLWDICACSTRRPSLNTALSDKSLQVVVVLKGAIEAVAVVPSFVKCFEDVHEVVFGETVEVRDSSIQLFDQRGLFVRFERFRFPIEKTTPFFETVVLGSESNTQIHNSGVKI